MIDNLFEARGNDYLYTASLTTDLSARKSK